MLEYDELGVGELDEEPVDALVDVERGLVVHCVSIAQMVVLVRVRVHRQVQRMHLLDELAQNVVRRRQLVHDPVGRHADTVRVLRDLVVIVRVRIVAELKEGQVSQRRHLFEAVGVERLDDDRDGGRSVGDVAHAVLLQHIEEHLSHVVPLGQIGIVVFQFNVEAGLGVSIDEARSVLDQHLNVLDDLVHRDNLESIVKHGRASRLILLEPLEHLQLGQIEILNVPIPIRSLLTLEKAGVLGDIGRFVQD